MQKTKSNASILIWAIFLSLIISITFISISTKINKSLKNNYNFTDEIKVNNQIKNIINKWSIDWNFNDEYLLNWDKIIFDPSNIITVWIKKWEIYTTKINVSSTININIINWWPIKYKNNSNSWLILNSTWILVTSWNLEISNLWWYSKIQISSNVKTNYLSKYRNYFILKNIWNKEVIESKWKIKNF